MAERDYVSAPISDSLGLGGVIAGLVGDLDALRAGTITVADAVARSLLAKQIFNGVRIYMNGTKYLSGAAILPASDADVGSNTITPDTSETTVTDPVRTTP